jgi:uncharacterized repeat protein (TIGR01451 family)
MMKPSKILYRLFNLFLMLVLLLPGILSQELPARAEMVDLSTSQDTPEREQMIVRLAFDSLEQLTRFVNELDVWEVHHDPDSAATGYVIALVTQAQYAALQQAGYTVAIDEEMTALLYLVPEPIPGQGPDSIPNYPCYRTVEETYADMAQLSVDYPDLAQWNDIGDSWDKIHPGDPAGYDIFVLVLTNQNRPGPKDKFFLMAEIHAREYTTAEMAARFAEYLLENYGSNPDVTWLLDYFEIHIVPMTNPDGRKWAEGGYSWRKNTDNAWGSCPVPPNTPPYAYGIDLNRNHSFKWGGASPDPCDATYQGPSAASEPETMIIQNYVATIFPDQRGPGDTDPAPSDATGVLITLHSYSQLVLWPWGWTGTDSPNHSQLRTLGRKMAYFNYYTPQQSYDLYPTTGTTDDWSYGTLGIASYTFEMGTSFFQGCSTFENTIYPNNLPALFYAFKAARRPYQNPAGPDSLNLTISNNYVIPGTPVNLTATANDTRYSGGEPVQTIAAARFSIDNPSWVDGTLTYSMSAVDGSFNETVEDIQGTIDTTGLSGGRHTIFVESQDAAGNWGVLSAIFLEIDTPPYAVSLTPESESEQADPGDVYTYTLQVNNLGDNQDTYTITLDSEWPATAPATIGPLPSGSSAPLEIVVTVPLSATHGESDLATVTATSQGEPGVFDASELTTTANDYSLQLSPSESSAQADPGQVATHTLTLTNTGGVTDTFFLDLDSPWSFGIPEAVGPLEPGASESFNVEITVPLSATNGESVVSLLSVASQGDPGEVAESLLTTTANDYQFSLSPQEQSSSGYPGDMVEYTLVVTNTGNAADNYNISIVSDWPSTIPESIGPLEPGDSISLPVEIEIPLSATPGDTGQATVTAASQHDPAQSASALLSTTALRRGPVIDPQTAALSALPGETVTYTFEVTNEGDLTDTYTLEITGADWVTTAPTTTGELAPGASVLINVNVTIPLEALEGELDASVLHVTSEIPGTQPAIAQITTTVAALYNLVLVPESATQSALPGEMVTYTLQLTNIGVSSDAYTITLSSTWTAELDFPLGPVLPAESITITVRVQVPLDAVFHDSDQAIVTAISQGDPTRVRTAVLTTRVEAAHRFYLPFIVLGAD